MLQAQCHSALRRSSPLFSCAWARYTGRRGHVKTTTPELQAEENLAAPQPNARVNLKSHYQQYIQDVPPRPPPINGPLREHQARAIEPRMQDLVEEINKDRIGSHDDKHF